LTNADQKDRAIFVKFVKDYRRVKNAFVNTVLVTGKVADDILAIKNADLGLSHA
jgi:soluble P-type ATPase